MVNLPAISLSPWGRRLLQRRNQRFVKEVDLFERQRTRVGQAGVAATDLDEALLVNRKKRVRRYAFAIGRERALLTIANERAFGDYFAKKS
jgi:hypothetical protein